jgi:hypothetical protein
MHLNRFTSSTQAQSPLAEHRGGNGFRAAELFTNDASVHLTKGRKFLAGEWPDDPSFGFLVHWALRREEMYDPASAPMRQRPRPSRWRILKRASSAGQIGNAAALPAESPKVFRRDKAVALRAAGISWRQIARELGVPMSTVIDSCRAKG